MRDKIRQIMNSKVDDRKTFAIIVAAGLACVMVASGAANALFAALVDAICNGVG